MCKDIVKCDNLASKTLAADNFFQSLYQKLAIACVVLDENGFCSHTNPAFELLAGQSSSALNRVSFISHIHPDQVDHFSELYSALLSGRIASFETENRWIRKQQEVTWVKCSLSRVVDLSGKEVCVVAQISDITRKKLVNSQLHSSESALEQCFNNAPIGMLWLDPLGLAWRINQSLLRFLDLSESAALGVPISNWLSKSHVSKINERLKAKRRVENYRASLKTSSGAKLSVLVDVVAIFEGEDFIRTDWFFRDITLRVDLERRVIEASELERRELGHELHDGLGQILHGAYFIASSMQQKLQRNGNEEHVDMNRIAACLNDAMTSVRSLAHGLQPVAALPEGLVSALGEHAVNIGQLYGIKCHFICPEPIEIQDPKVATHLFRITQESLNNAIKHSQCQQVCITFKQNGAALLLEVSDDGVSNIPEQSIRSGMGLRVMQFRAHAIGAELTVERNQHGGTAVCCCIDPFFN